MICFHINHSLSNILNDPFRKQPFHYNYYWLRYMAIKWILIFSTTYIWLEKMFLKSQKSFWQRVLGEISEGVYSFILEGSMRIQLTETHTHIPLSRPGPFKQTEKSNVHRSDERGQVSKCALGSMCPRQKAWFLLKGRLSLLQINLTYF